MARLEAELCSQCGAPLTGKKCEYCGTRYRNCAGVDEDIALRVNLYNIERAYDCSGNMIMEYTRQLNSLMD